MTTPFSLLNESGATEIDAESGSPILVDVAPPPPIGSQADILSRLQQLLPQGWFANGASAIKDAILAGAANAFAFIFSMLAYLRLQTRIATATDGFLDLIAFDFFGNSLPRAGAQLDQSYRARIQSSLFTQRNTRPSLIAVLTKITGRVPIVFEPARAADTGALNIGTLAYGVAGAYGSLSTPYQSFITAFRPLAGSPQFGITDADIYAAIEGVRMGGTICWVKILT
jgi:hypothetical protein